MTQFFTSESVSMGHPDKMADQISDAILDAMLVEDPHARVACETLVTTGMAVIAGEVTCDGYVEIADVVRNVVRDIGYDDGSKGFDGTSCSVLVALGKQSPDIAMGVNESEDHKQGAGDQGLMFGFACRETEDLAPGTYMPLPIFLSHRLVEKHADVRRSNLIPSLRPDAKSQVTVQYDGDKPVRVDTVVLSTQHGPEWNNDQKGLKEAVTEHILKPTLADQWHDDITVHVNPTGRFEIGGPQGDAGLTGRKIIVDTYGGRGRHGGGAFSGKDPSKVDRSATYMARYIAKNLVAAGLADIVEVQLSYAIGVAEPTSVHVDCMGTEKVDPATLATLVREHFDLTPSGIIKSLDLLRPIYRPTSYHGHFGRVPAERSFEYTKNGATKKVNAGETFPWEKTDKAATLKSAAGSYATASA